MESLPPRRAAQRRRSPEHASLNNSPPRTTARAASPIDSHSLPSQTVCADDAESQKEQVPAESETLGTDGEVKKCWICFADSTEDTAETSPWRDPCPCALVAHEACLLDWIADMEAPNNRRTQQRGFGPPKIECPQCKKEITLVRPRSLVVDAVRRIERAGLQLTTPGALTVLFGLLYNGSMAWGVHTIYAIFGTEDGSRILQPLVMNAIRPRLDLDTATGRDLGERLLGGALSYLAHWRLYVGLPLITPAIILSRTNFADSVLPVLPVLFFATQSSSPQDTLDFGQWPPSAGLAFSVLPYLRLAYNFYYQKVWAPKEKQWLSEIQPRARDGDAEAAVDEPPVDGDDDGDENVVEVRIDGGLWEEWEDEDLNEERPEGLAAGEDAQQPPPIHFQDAREAAHAEPLPDIADAQELQQQRPLPAADQQNQDGAHQPHRPQNRIAGAGPRRLSFSPTDIAETFLGSLVFPTIAGLSGQLLKFVLPQPWTTRYSLVGGTRVRFFASGLLQERWGRSLVGGCLFVVLKDCIMLYVKWKMAQMHRQRKVVDYQGTRRPRASLS